MNSESLSMYLYIKERNAIFPKYATCFHIFYMDVCLPPQLPTMRKRFPLGISHWASVTFYSV